MDLVGLVAVVGDGNPLGMLSESASIWVAENIRGGRLVVRSQKAFEGFRKEVEERWDEVEILIADAQVVR